MTKLIGLCLQGSLEKWDQEGGHASPSVSIGNEDVAAAIEEMLEKAGVELVHDSSPPVHSNEGIAAGKWILTLVRYQK